MLLLGTCPTLATTTSAVNGLGMGVSTMAVLICSNIVISLLKKDVSLRAFTSLWMFFIYGMAVFMEPVFIASGGLPFFIRGLIYMLLIFCAEYLTGYLLERSIGKCPWNYEGAALSVYGLIRLDYEPVWFAVGIIYENVYFNIMPLINLP